MFPMKSIGIPILLFSIVTIFAVQTLPAQQSGAATINGTVIDPSGRPVTGCMLTLTNLAQGTVRTYTTTNDGNYSFTDIGATKYELSTKETAGFSSYKQEISIAVGQVLRLPIQLKVSASQSQIEVVSNPQVEINTSTSVVGGVIGASQISSLPLNGRNYLELSLLVPGNSPAPNFDPTKQDTVLISSAGQFGRGANVTVDGADNNDDAVGGSLVNIPEDAVQEFEIATNRFSATTGRSGSSVTNVITKQGTNNVHGSVAFFERDNVLQGLPATFNRELGETPTFHRQQYAGNVGGPFRKDKAWWFVAMEDRQQLGADLVGVRNTATRTIDNAFSSAPLHDYLLTGRVDWQITEKDRVGVRESLQLFDNAGASQLDRAIGTADYRQTVNNHFNSLVADWVHIFTPTLINRLSFADNNFSNATIPTSLTPQISFPSIDDGATYRNPQKTTQFRLQYDDTVSWTKGRHSMSFGGELQSINAEFYLGVFQQGNIQAVEDFPDFDRNGDGKVDDNDILFAVALRSTNPSSALVLPNCDNYHLAFFGQDDWKVLPNLTINAGLRWEMDTNLNNLSWYPQRNPLVDSFYTGTRGRQYLDFAPRVGFNYMPVPTTSIHGGYGIYYDRITLEIMSLERGLDGTALALNVTAGNVVSGPDGPAYLNPDGTFKPGAPELVSSPFSGFLFAGAGATGIDIIDNRLRNPMVQQFNVGIEQSLGTNFMFKLDGVHNLGTRFIIGRPDGSIPYNPVTGGPETVTNLESSVNTKYDALWATLHKQFIKRGQFDIAYTLAKAYNYANDDQIPFEYAPIDPNDLHREYGPPPNDQRSRIVLSGVANMPWQLVFSPIWTMATGVPMDILLPGASERVPTIQRNAGGRQFHNAAQLNTFISQTNAAGGVETPNGTVMLPFVDNNARFNDSFNSLDFRLSRNFKITERFNITAIGEAFNIFNMTNILGNSNLNYSGFNNTLSPDTDNPLYSSTFGKPVTTAGGVFGSGGPRAFQLAARFNF